MNAMHFKINQLSRYKLKWFYYIVKSLAFNFLNHYQLKSLLFQFFSFNAGHIGFETSFVSVSLLIVVSSSYIFSSLDGYLSFASLIIYIQIIVYFIMVSKIYMVAPSNWTSSLFKYRRILVIVAFLTSSEYLPETSKASIRISGSTSILQYNACCTSDRSSIKCLKHLVQKCFFIDFLYEPL